MPFIEYVPKRFSTEHRKIIETARQIASEYALMGFDLTLRQMYYQFVSRDIIPNNVQSYKRLGSILNDARLAGEIDWDSITDRTRNLVTRSHWESPQQIIRAVANQYHRDMWERQPSRVEVWIEKDALSGVIAGICTELDVPYFSCRGYTSQSEVWGAAQRIGEYLGNEQACHVIHLGDHDPSGIDMTRDIEDRLRLFLVGDGRDDEGFTLERIALNEDQILQYDPPPNPAKITDSRATKYIERHGTESWELDALAPDVIVDLIRGKIEELIRRDLWREDASRIEREKGALQAVNRNYDAVVKFLSDSGLE